MIKWSNTMQNRDAVHVIFLPKLKNPLLCPFRSLFQVHTAMGWQTLMDTKVRKCLKAINMTLGLNPHFFTFHSLRRSGATFAYNCHVPIQHIKRHGTWSSECVWHYNQADHSAGETLAFSLANAINV